MKFKLLLLFILFPLLMHGQDIIYFKVSGTIKDTCVEDLNFRATVSLYSNHQYTRRVIADTKGHFTFDSIEAGTVSHLRFQAAGYFSASRVYKLEKDSFLNIRLAPIPLISELLPYIQFQFNSESISLNYTDSLTGFIQTLNNNPTLIIGIMGFTDSSETPGLVEARMENTLQLLLSLGIDSNRLRKTKSKTPARASGIDPIYYDCETKRFVYGKLVTESYINQFKDIKKQEYLRAFNRSVQFRIIAD